MLKIINYLIFIFVLSSCAWTRKQGINFLSPAFETGVLDAYKIRDWKYFKDSVPSNILLLETLLANSPQNKNILSQLIKLHFSYGFGVYETLILEDQYSKYNKKSKESALYHYSRAIELGQKYLEVEGVKYKDLKRTILSEEKLKKLLTENFDKDDSLALFYIGAAISSSLNLQKDNAKLLTLVPMGKGLINWACTETPKIDLGICNSFNAVYLLSRPKMLGGNPSLGIKNLKKMIKENPSNLLNQVILIQYSYIPSNHKKAFKLTLNQTQRFIENFNKQKKDFDYLLKNDFSKTSAYNLYNAIAIKRIEILKKYQRQVF